MKPPRPSGVTAIKPARAQKAATRLIDVLITDGRFHEGQLPGLESALDALRTTWADPESTLNNWQARGVLELLESVFSPSRPESFTSVRRARGIAFDWWYRTDWLSEIPKNAMKDICNAWGLGRSEVMKAKRAGYDYAMRAYTPLVGASPKGQRVPHIETMLENWRQTQRGSLRVR